jgi:hypothetical protein
MLLQHYNMSLLENKLSKCKSKYSESFSLNLKYKLWLSILTIFHKNGIVSLVIWIIVIK